MLNLFQLSPNDQSVYYLGQIFGMVGDVIPVQSAATGVSASGMAVNTGTATLIFGVMFKVFNTIALTVGAFLITYTTVVGLLKTAAEGEFLGKHWQSLWVPIRMVFGTAALFPGASGYSFAQIIIMWLVMQGVAGADTLWAAVLNYMNAAGGSILSSYSPPTSDVKTQIETLFQGLVCQETIRAKYPDINITAGTGNKFYWYCGHGNNGQTPYCQQTDAQTYDVIDGAQVSGQTSDTIAYSLAMGNCGTMKYANPLSTTKPVCETDPNHPDWGPNSISCLSYQGQQQALQTIVPVFSAIAKQYVQTDHDYVSFYETPATQPRAMNGMGQINNTQELQFVDSNGNTTETAAWITTYCTTPTTADPPGLGLDPDQCCVTPNTQSSTGQGCATASFPKDYYKTGGAWKMTDTDPNAVDQAYLPFSIQPYLGANLDFIDAAVNQFIQQGITGPYQNYITSLPASSLNNTPYQKIYEDGWLMAGSYYFKLTNTMQGTIKAASSTLKVSQAHVTLDMSYRWNYDSAGWLLGDIYGAGSDEGALAATGLGAVTPHRDPIAGAKNDIVSGFIKAVAGGPQPILQASHYGFMLMALTQTLFVTIPLANAVIVMAVSANWITIGTGFTLPWWAEGIKAFVNFLLPFYVALLVALFSIGALLGIYVPLIPFTIYAVTALGWFIATIEAMIASPLIALGIMMPSGQHEIMGKADASIMIVFNLILRPVLMVFGLIAGMVLCTQIVNFLNIGFARITGTILPTVGLVEQIIFMAIYVNLFMIIVNKAFSLIYEVPARALMYIGGHQIGFGEAEALGQVKQAAQGAAGGMSGASKGAGRGAIAGTDKAGKAYQKEQEDKNRDQDAIEGQQEGQGEAPAGDGGGGEGEEK